MEGERGREEEVREGWGFERGEGRREGRGEERGKKVL